MNFKKWVKSMQTVGYNGARTVYTFGVFSSNLSAAILVLCSVYPYQSLFLQKTKPLYQNPKYLFGIGI